MDLPKPVGIGQSPSHNPSLSIGGVRLGKSIKVRFSDRQIEFLNLMLHGGARPRRKCRSCMKYHPVGCALKCKPKRCQKYSQEVPQLGDQSVVITNLSWVWSKAASRLAWNLLFSQMGPRWAGSGSEPRGPRPTPWPTAVPGRAARRAGRGSSASPLAKLLATSRRKARLAFLIPEAGHPQRVSPVSQPSGLLAAPARLRAPSSALCAGAGCWLLAAGCCERNLKPVEISRVASSGALRARPTRHATCAATERGWPLDDMSVEICAHAV
jgi:hypothetical protein